MSKKVKACINCQNCVSWEKNFTDSYCHAHMVKNLVDGMFEFVLCKEMRKDEYLCGRQAKLFEEKEY